MKMLKFSLALLNLAALASLFIDRTQWTMEHLAWLARFQWLPAVLALDWIALVALTAFAFAFGRAYCETLCPLGALQEVCRLARWTRTRRVCSRLPQTRTQVMVRWGVFAFVLAAGFAGGGFLWLDPWGIFARAASLVAQPAPDQLFVAFGGGVCALVAGLAFVGQGRFWCNWICPVGTLLDVVSRRAWKRDRVSKSARCDRCRACWGVGGEEE